MKLALTVFSVLAFIWLAWSLAAPTVDRIKDHQNAGAALLESAGLAIRSASR